MLPVLVTICAQLDEIDARRARADATNAAAAAAAENKRRAAGGGIGTTTLGYSLDDLPEAPTGHPSSSKSVGSYGPSAAAAAAAAQPPPTMGATMPPLYPPPPAGAAAGLYAPSAPPPPSAGGDFYGGYGGAAAVGGGAAVGGAALQDAFRSLSLDQVKILGVNEGRLFMFAFVQNDGGGSRLMRYRPPT